MRRRFAIPLIVIVAAVPWFWFKPTPSMDSQGAELVAVLDFADEGDWFGGLSGIELSADGLQFHLITDRGHRATGMLLRKRNILSGYEIEKWQPFLDKNGVERDFPHTDGEGLAVASDGTVFVSFEHAHRVLFYPSWDSAAKWPSYTRSWRALAANRGLEALAIESDGTLYALPEAILEGAYETLVYRRRPNERWDQPFTIPVDRQFKPVGADFGPDGRLYLLERGLYPFAFYSRVRSMRVDNTGVSDIVTELETPLGRHSNLEGIAVWEDSDGSIRLTMVSDDNFLFFMRSQLVEYRLTPRVAQAAK